MAVLPEEINTKTFAVVYGRGYDRNEVSSYLREVATSYRAAIDKIARISNQQGLEALGEEVKAVLSAAASSSEQIISRAETKAGEIVSDAKSKADRTRKESEKRAAEAKRRTFEETQAAIEDAEKAAQELSTSTERRCADLLDEAEQRHQYLVARETELRTRMAKVVEIVDSIEGEFQLSDPAEAGAEAAASADVIPGIVKLAESEMAAQDKADEPQSDDNGASDPAPVFSRGASPRTSG